MNEMKQKQGGSSEDAPRCPPHPGIVLGLCSMCGAKEEAAESGAPAAAVGHEATKQGGDGDGYGDNYAASCPPHPGFVHGLSSRCGAEEEAGGGAPLPLGVAIGYVATNQGGGSAYGGGVTVARLHGEGSVSVPPALEAATIVVSASDRATLMRERKLILILDLDHTLLNSTGVDDLSPDEQDNGITPDMIGDPDIDLYRLRSEDLGADTDMLIKLRPFAGDFLEQASALFEMHVYTHGSRRYAREAVGKLDPDGVYLGRRIVSRDESTGTNAKSLDVIQGAEPITVVILDDSKHVWPDHQDNLILMERYLYFASGCRKFGYHIPSLAELSLVENEMDQHDYPLAVVLGVLKRVHNDFFDGDRADVRDVIAEVRRQVLPECTLVFSYLEESMEDFPEDSELWELAEQFGAACREDVDETVTHVVAEDPGSQKAQWAREHGKFLVNPGWIMMVGFRWRRVDEGWFPVTAHAN